MEHAKIKLLGLFLVCFLSGCIRTCSPTPRPIKLGEDACEQCHMSIAAPRFAAEIVTHKGRVYKFDSLTCLLQYYKNLKEEPRAIFAADYFTPATFIDVNAAHFFISAEIQGPMGPTPIASQNLVELKKIAEKFKGDISDWKSIIAAEK